LNFVTVELTTVTRGEIVRNIKIQHGTDLLRPVHLPKIFDGKK